MHGFIDCHAHLSANEFNHVSFLYKFPQFISFIKMTCFLMVCLRDKFEIN